MKLWTMCVAGALLGALGSRAAVEFPVPVHAGQLEKVERTETPQPFVELQSAWLNGNREPAMTEGDVTTREIPPRNGSVFVVFTVTVEAGRTLSVSDYELSCGTAKGKCLGFVRPAVNAYDARLNLVKGPARVKMLFEAPASAMKASLVAAPGYPLYDVTDIELQKPAPPPEAPAPAPEKAVDKAEAAKTEADEDGAVPTKVKPVAPGAKKDAPAKKPAPAPQKPAPPKPAEKKPAPPKPAPPKPAPPKPKPADDWF